MGLEKRGNRHYYYSKIRIAGRVISRYQGGGRDAELIALLTDRDRQARQEEQATHREALRAEFADLEAEALDLAPLDALVQTITRAALVADGCYTHSRQWRRKRGESAGDGMGDPAK